MREILGFVAGIATGAAATVIATSESGRLLRERLLTEADPEIRGALEDWAPLIREGARAIRLAARELEETVQRAAQIISDLAEAEAAPGAMAHDGEPGTIADAPAIGPAVAAVAADAADVTQHAEP